MPNPDLLELWDARTADAAELEQLLLHHFGKVRYANEGYALYGKDDENPGLIVSYRKGQLVRADAGSGYTQADHDALSLHIRGALLARDASEIERRILFTTLRVRGFYRYADRFQLIPVPPEAPQPQIAMPGGHPALLEVRYGQSADAMIAMLRKARAEREIELLLAVFLWLPIEHLGNPRFHWVLEPSTDTLPTSSHRQEGYHWPGDRPVRDVFSTTENLTAMPLIEPSTYYARYNYSVTDCLDLPANLTEMFDRFFALETDAQQSFLRAAYWFHHASNVWSVSHSAAFTAMVSAVEAIMPPPVASEACPTCRRRSGPGPTAQFEAFVEQHASARQISADQRKAFYRTRSALAHGGRLLHNDQRLWGVGLTSVLELQDLRALSNVVRAVLCDWLQTCVPAE